MKSNKYLTSFRPLIANAAGLCVTIKYSLPPFIDGSCRREPDLELEWPSVTALCRGSKFAPKLDVGDELFYITVKHKYHDLKESHYRLVAILRVAERFETHREAAIWYRQHSDRLPYNCMVPGNAPLPYDKTNKSQPDLNMWDKHYWSRASKYPTFLRCEKLFLDIYCPPVIIVSDLKAIFGGKVPGTQNPKMITTTEAEEMQKLATIRRDSALGFHMETNKTLHR
jgi:hypothetical protein